MAIKLADALIEAFIDYSKAEKGAGEMEAKIGGLTKGTVAKLSTAMTAAGAAITGSLGVATAKATEFGDGLGNVATLGVQDLDGLKHGTMDVARQFGIDLNDAIQVTYDTLSAGIPEDAAIMVMEQAARGARAGVGSLSEAMDLGTSVMNAWQLQGDSATETAANFEEIMGLAASTVKAGKTTIAELTQAIGATAPVMSAAGVGTEEFFAAIGALTKTGMPAAQAMNSLKAAVSNVIKPGEQAGKTAEALGLEFNAAALESQGLAGFLQQVAEKTGGNVETMGQLFGSVEGLNAIMALTGTQADSFTQILGDMGNATMNLAEMNAAYIQANPAEAFRQMKVEMQVLMVQIGENLIPVLVRLAQMIKPVLEGVNTFIRENPGLATGLTITAGAVGVLATALGSLGLILTPLLPSVIAFGPAAAGAGAAAAGAGTAAGGAAVGFGALALSVGGFLLAAGAVGAILAASGFAIYKFGQTAIETVQAYRELEESNRAVERSTEQYIQTLKRQGVALDEVAMKGMTHAERSAYLTQQSVMAKENAMAREIHALTGLEATRDQIHRAEMARVGLQVSAAEAAALAVEGITKEEIQARMQKAEVAVETEQRIQEAERQTVDESARQTARDLANATEAAGFIRATEEDVVKYRQRLQEHDLETAEAFWKATRGITNTALTASLEDYHRFRLAVQAEMAELRKSVAYAINPDQTGSPSLNMEMAAGLANSERQFFDHTQNIVGMYNALREEAQRQLAAMGGGIFGPGGPGGGALMPSGSQAPAVRSSSSAITSSPVSISAPVHVEIHGSIDKDAAGILSDRLPKEWIRQIRDELGRGLEREGRGMGLRGPAMTRRPSVT